jgi:5-formyltetrahydrofolate cyclo-ligase
MKSPLDPAFEQEVVLLAKKQLRSRMRAIRQAHSASSLRLKSEAIVARVLDAIPDGSRVALFWPMEQRKEVDLRLLDQALRQRAGCAIYYPFMDPLPQGGFRTGFRLTQAVSDLCDRGRKFVEPDPEAPIAAAGDVDFVLVPALAADARGHRIGYGAGYYDATLSDLCPPAKSWIVVFEFQLLAELPIEKHDLACSRVFTEKRSLDCTASSV